MSSKTQMTRFEAMRVLLMVASVAVLAASCSSQGGSAPAPTPDDEYELITKEHREALENGPMPIAEAMAKLASQDRAEFAAITPKPSEDQSAINGWSFSGDAPVATADVAMPAECQGAADPMACWGQKLSGSKGCAACHGVDGQRQQPCPNWLGLYGKERPLVSGETVVADEEYLANSIVNSWDQIVEGYGKVMPPYNMPQQEVDALVAYLKSLGEGG